MPKTTKPKKAVTTSSPAGTRGPVKHVKAKVGHTPTVRRKPTGSRERKVIQQTEGADERFWVKVKRQYFG